MRSLKMLLALAAGPLALGLSPTHASAQVFMQQNPPGTIGQYAPPRVGLGGPAYSPYNNLNRPGGAANNYLGIVRPQIDASRAINQIQQQQAVGPGPAEEGYQIGGQQLSRDPANLLQTGHAVTFGNTAQYFPQQTGAVRGVNGAGGYGNRAFATNSPYAPYGVGGGGFTVGNALIGGNLYNGAVNTPNASILIGPNGPAVINRLP